jgi:mRNA-degrading endonuclease toxin of MazEF toxin-antitoxin module
MLLRSSGMHVLGIRRLARRRDRAAAAEGSLIALHAALYLTVVLWVLSPVKALAFVAVQQAVFRPEIETGGTRTLVLVDQMRAVDASRLGDFAGRLDAAETGEVDRAIKLILGTL